MNTSSDNTFSLFRLIDKLSEYTGKIFAWLSLPMIAVIVYEVVSNGIFDKPTDWAHQSSTMFYGTFCMIGAVWTLRERRHVRTEVIHQTLPLRLQYFCDVLTGFIILAMLVILFLATFKYAKESWIAQEFSQTSTWKVAIYPFKSVMPFAVGLMCLQQLANLLRDIVRLFQRHHQIDDLSIED